MGSAVSYGTRGREQKHSWIRSRGIGILVVKNQEGPSFESVTASVYSVDFLRNNQCPIAFCRWGVGPFVLVILLLSSRPDSRISWTSVSVPWVCGRSILSHNESRLSLQEAIYYGHLMIFSNDTI